MHALLNISGDIAYDLTAKVIEVTIIYGGTVCNNLVRIRGEIILIRGEPCDILTGSRVLKKVS